MRFSVALLSLTAASLCAADFQSGQAARAVFGQSSFSSRDNSITPSSLIVLRNRLYAADISHRVWTFDLSKVGDPKSAVEGRGSGGCSVCIAGATAVNNQSVSPSVASVSGWGKAIAIVDTIRHRVLVWRDSGSTRDGHGPDVILGRTSEGNGPAVLVNPVSVAIDGKRLFVGDAALHRVLVWNSIPSTDDQPADAVLGQPDFQTTAGPEVPRADSISVPAALASDGNNLFVADSVEHRILIFSPADLLLPPDAVLNAGSLSEGPLAPGTLVTIRSARPADAGGPLISREDGELPHVLGGTEIILDGEAIPILSVSPDEVEAQLPYSIADRRSGSMYLRTVRPNGAVTISTPVSVNFSDATPGLFAFSGTEPRPGMLLHSDEAGALAVSSPVTPESKAKLGEVLTVWATGLGAVEVGRDDELIAGHPFAGPAADVVTRLTASVDGQAVEVISAKLPAGAVGVYEIQIALPASLDIDSPAHLSVSQNGFTSNTVTFPVER